MAILREYVALAERKSPKMPLICVLKAGSELVNELHVKFVQKAEVK